MAKHLDCRAKDSMVCGTVSRHRQDGVWDTVMPQTSWCGTVTPQTVWFVGHCHTTDIMVWDTVTPQTVWCVGHCHATDSMVCGTLSRYIVLCGTLSRHRQYGLLETGSPRTVWFVAHCHVTDSIVCGTLIQRGITPKEQRLRKISSRAPKRICGSHPGLQYLGQCRNIQKNNQKKKKIGLWS